MNHRLILSWLAGLILVAAAALVPAHGFGLSLPPDVTEETAESASRALVDLLNRTSGEHFEFHRSQNAHAYLRDITEATHALVVTQNHILGRLQQLNYYSAIWFLEHTTSFVVVVASDDNTVYELGDLAGKNICAGPIPALFTMHLLYTVDNPQQEPVIRPVEENKRRVRHLLSGRCSAAILDIDSYQHLQSSPEGARLKIVFQSRSIPIYGVGINQRMPLPLRERLVQILRSKEGRQALQPVSRLLTGSESALKRPDHRRLKSLSAIVEDWLF